MSIFPVQACQCLVAEYSNPSKYYPILLACDVQRVTCRSDVMIDRQPPAKNWRHEHYCIVPTCAGCISIASHSQTAVREPNSLWWSLATYAFGFWQARSLYALHSVNQSHESEGSGSWRVKDI
ncbi:hypothetical protein KC338_g86 [Hortaea werneckii]|nr:hypothetical protein KC338_g86 [Hortaea werneckii]